jgi:Zn-dependent protease with chaperone function
VILAAALLLGAFLAGRWTPGPLERLIASRIAPAVTIAWWFLTCLGIIVSIVFGVVLLALPDRTLAEHVIHVIHNCWTELHHGKSPDLGPIAGMVAMALVCFATTRLGLSIAKRRRIRKEVHQTHLDALRIMEPRATRATPTLWLRHDDPLAYSIGGRNALIVASHGLAERLTPPELQAVLAHEHAHVRGRHHMLVSLADALGKSLRFIPAFRRLPMAIRILVELAADRAAVRQCGPDVVRSALTAISSRDTPPKALGMSGGDIAFRVSRLGHHQLRKTMLGARLTAVVGGACVALTPAIIACALLVISNAIVCP